jgi:multiple sugar transport system substrate-binding protein
LKSGAQAAAAVAAAGAVAPALSTPSVFARSPRSSTTLNFLTGLAGPDGTTMQGIVAQFNKLHPDISVKMQIIGSWPEFYSKLLPALTAGNAPEVFTTHVQEMLYFQANGLFMKVDDLFGPSLPESDFAKQPMQYVTYQGSIYGMPLDMHGWGFYLNPKLLQAAGLPLRTPSSGEELVQWARKLTMDKNGNNGLSANFDSSNVKVYGLATSWDAPPTFLTTLWSFGGNTLSSDGKTALFNTPQMRDAVNFWNDLIFKYHAVAKPSSYGAVGVWDSAYAKNQVAMVPDGDWMRNWFPAHKNVSVKAVFMPPFGSKQVTWMSGHVIAAPASLPSEKKDAVYTFMRYLSSQGVAWTTGAGHIPARISQRKSSAVMSLFPQNVYGPELSEIGRIEQPSTVFFDVQDAYTAEIDAAWNGTKSVAAALSSAQSRVSRALSQVH